MRTKTLYLPLAAFIVISMLLGACNTATQAPSATATQEVATATTTATVSVKTKNYVLVPIMMNSYYFDVANKGAQEAARQLGVTVIYQGPTTADANQQIQLLNTVIAQKVDGLAVAAVDANALVATGQAAMKAGIPVVSWDSAIGIAGRNLQISPPTPEDIGRAQVQLMAKLLDKTGKFAILSAAQDATTQNEYIKWMKDELTKPDYANMTLVDTVYGDDDDAKSFQQTQLLMKTYPDLKGIIAPTTVGLAAAARAVQEAVKVGQVIVTGLGNPNQMRDYVKNGACPSFVNWSPYDLGYLTVFALDAIASGRIKGAAGDTIDAGKLGNFTIAADGSVPLGPPIIFNKDNIGNYDF